jgi:hypothetical protein
LKFRRNFAKKKKNTPCFLIRPKNNNAIAAPNTMTKIDSIMKLTKIKANRITNTAENSLHFSNKKTGEVLEKA